VAMAAVVSLSKCFIMGMVVVLLQILLVALILALMIRQK
jgi:hypothetical protein